MRIIVLLIFISNEKKQKLRIVLIFAQSTSSALAQSTNSALAQPTNSALAQPTNGDTQKL